jgi:hypothetical protein
LQPCVGRVMSYELIRRAIDVEIGNAHSGLRCAACHVDPRYPWLGIAVPFQTPDPPCCTFCTNPGRKTARQTSRTPSRPMAIAGMTYCVPRINASLLMIPTIMLCTGRYLADEVIENLAALLG